MSTLQIELEETESRGRFTASLDGSPTESELTFSKAGTTNVIADHTYVPDHLRGQGIAEALVERLLEEARSRSWKVVPLCPYVKSYALQHRDAVSDVVQF